MEYRHQTKHISQIAETENQTLSQKRYLYGKLIEMRVFISYSHKDTEYVENLKAHLATLIRDQSITLWSDHLLVPGDELNPEIRDALSNADVFLSIMSSAYLASYYCVEIELAQALKERSHRGLRIVTVVARACDWLNTELAKYSALPHDGKPISLWSDEDSAYLNVARGLREVCEHRSQAAFKEKEAPASGLIPEISCDWKSYLNDTDISFKNPRKKTIELNDIYVSPHLQILDDSEHDREYTSIEAVLSGLEADRYHLLVSNDQAGKSTLLKVAYDNFLSTGGLPIALDGKRISTTDVTSLLKRALKEQYKSITLEDVQTRGLRILVLIDNFHASRLNRTHQEKLLDRLKANCYALVVFSSNSLSMQVPEFLSESSGFRMLKLLDFGHLKRSELIRKWLEAGIAETVNEHELNRDISKFERHVNSIIRNNIVPSRPIFLLSILQSLETAIGGDYRLTSYGHCYNYLIEQALQNGSIRSDELDTFINLLTHLAYFQYKGDIHVVDDSEWVNFKNEYSACYIWPKNAKESLLACRVLRNRQSGVAFSHKYIYFYYAGKYISELVERDESAEEVERLCDNLHLETNANILIFVTHHTRSRRVIETIALYADEPFRDRRPASLSKDQAGFLATNLQEIHDLVIESRNVPEERERRARELDARDETSSQRELEESTLDPNSTLAHITSSSKTVEIVGQIVRNRHGSLSRQELDTLSEAGLDAGLRFLDYFLGLIEESESGITEMIARAVESQGEPQSENAAKRLARSIYSRFCYGGVLSILNKIAAALGHKKTLELFRALRDRRPEYISIQLIYISLLMEFRSEFPRSEVESVYLSLGNHVVAVRLLREMVVSHLYLNYVERGDKQWIASTLQIPMQTQHRIEGRAKEKSLPKI